MTVLYAFVTYFFVFCRIGACLMIAPGFSSDRIPVRSRLYLSLAIALLISPLMGDLFTLNNKIYDYIFILKLIFHELFVGLILGFLCRIFLFAVETLITTFCLTIGLSNIFNTGYFENDSAPTLSTLMILASIQLIFITDLHHYFIQFVDHSYQVTPIYADLDIGNFVVQILEMLAQSFLIALRLSSPFLLFAIIVNLSFAFLARLSPQTPIYFVSGPCVIFLGLYIFYVSLSDFLGSFISSFHQLIVRG